DGEGQQAAQKEGPPRAVIHALEIVEDRAGHVASARVGGRPGHWAHRRRTATALTCVSVFQIVRGTNVERGKTSPARRRRVCRARRRAIASGATRVREPNDEAARQAARRPGEAGAPGRLGSWRHAGIQEGRGEPGRTRKEPGPPG